MYKYKCLLDLSNHSISVQEVWFNTQVFDGLCDVFHCHEKIIFLKSENKKTRKRLGLTDVVLAWFLSYFLAV